jgi:NaMN:DMB phosphoribosyltransferase
MAIAASRIAGVLLAGGTQMLAVHALLQAIARGSRHPLDLDRIVVGTTRWVAEDPGGDTVGLAELVGEIPLLASRLNFSRSKFPALRAYERGFVKEGVGAGGCALISSLYANWTNERLVRAIESLLARTG